MPRLGEAQDRQHPWFGKYRAASDVKRARLQSAPRPKLKREVEACPHCGDPHCYFGECDGREF
jgi:hypothetical protein